MTTDHIEARSITLLDSNNQPRIIMDAGDQSGYASILLISNDKSMLSVSAQPSGKVILSFDKQPMSGMLTISSDGICLRASDGKLAISIGRPFADNVDRVVVCRDGQPIWQEPS